MDSVSFFDYKKETNNYLHNIFYNKMNIFIIKNVM